ncbi:MAG: hypothetical protein LBD68_07595 [Zoogloeaceae bacterium]|jgi:hypothetical protein|nr:hypothetical protein [Zoogloeaceae bacterium]
MKAMAMLFMLALLSGCATRHAEYAGYAEYPYPRVLFGAPGYYYRVERYSPVVVYPAAPAPRRWHDDGKAHGNALTVPSSPPRVSHGVGGQAKPRPRAGGHQGRNGGDVSARPDRRASYSGDDKGNGGRASATPQRQGGKSAFGANRAMPANRIGGAQSGARSKMTR